MKAVKFIFVGLFVVITILAMWESIITTSEKACPKGYDPGDIGVVTKNRNFISGFRNEMSIRIEKKK